MEAAALALGASRCEGAFELLSSHLGDVGSSVTQSILLAISRLRREAPIAYLLRLAEAAPWRRAESAIKSLAIHRYDPRFCEKLEKAVRRRDDNKRLLALVASEVGSPAP